MRGEPGPVWSFPMLLCLVVGLLGTLPLVILTPPFQVPDEAQHFDRAYQISEGGLRAEIRDGKAGGSLPTSLPALARRFLGTDAILAVRRVTATPLTGTLRLRAIPLDPGGRVFVDFTGAAAYPPLAYLPQAAGIGIGRAFGAGPLMLLYLARIANALTAIAVLSVAIGLMPVGQGPALLGGLLPMALYEYASASPDALVIGGSFLLTALGLRALQRGAWLRPEVLGAALAGLVVCATKPVYAPLLLIAAPALLISGRHGHHLCALAVILGVALGGTALWFAWDSGRVIPFEPGVDLHAQLGFMRAHPAGLIAVIRRSLAIDGRFYLISMIGLLGWLTVLLPRFAYLLPGIGLLPACLARDRAHPRLSVPMVFWCALLCAGAAALTMIAMYLACTPVGAPIVLGVQGRYFLPLLALVAAMAGSLPALRIGSRASVMLLAAVAGIVVLDAAVAAAAIGSVFAVL